jgi:hypothetical protein
MGTMARLANFVVRLALTAAVTGLMLVPTGICLCGHEESCPTEDHQPGCPEVRNLDRPGPAVVAPADRTATGIVAMTDLAPAAGPARAVSAVGHSPPRGQPLYVTLQTLLI